MSAYGRGNSKVRYDRNGQFENVAPGQDFDKHFLSSRAVG